MPFQEIIATITEDNFDLTKNDINQYQITIAEESFTFQPNLINHSNNIVSASYALSASYAPSTAHTGLWTSSLDGSISRLSDVKITGSLDAIKNSPGSVVTITQQQAWGTGGIYDQYGLTVNGYSKLGNFRINADDPYNSLYKIVPGNLAFSVSDVSADINYGNPVFRFMTLKSDGKVGIGVTDPNANLEVSGSTHFGNSTTDVHQITGSLEVSGSITAERIYQNKIYHAYGGFQDHAYTFPLITNEWTKITNGAGIWTGSEADGLTLSNDVMTFVSGGDYTGNLSMTFAALNSKDFEVRVFNLTTSQSQGFHMGVTTTGATNYANLSLPLYLEVNSGDQYEMQMKSADGTDPILRSAVFYISYLHN